MNNNIVLV